MTALRTAAQQALEALEIGYDSAQAEAHQFHAAMAGYKPQRHAAIDADVEKIARAITALRAALAEPVPWLRVIDEAMVTHHLGVADPADDYETAKRKLNDLLCCAQDIGAYFAKQAEPVQEPYLAPPQRKPLTEEERNFCPRCGKRTNDIHTCTPP